MKTKQMFAVEYKSACDGQTFDIFPSLKKANVFAESVLSFGKEYKPLFIFKAKFNSESIFKDESGVWNYDDYSDTYDLNSAIILQRFN